MDVRRNLGSILQRGRLSQILHAIEILFALLLVAIVVIASAYYLGGLLSVRDDFLHSFKSDFEDLLSNILLLIVGIELAELMVVRERTKILDVMVFVVARKVLLEKDVLNILIGSIILTLLFATRLLLLRFDSKGAKD